MPLPLPKFDRLGRPQHDPHRLMHGIEGALKLAEWAPEGARQVPPEFWLLDASDLSEPVAVVSCPCGHSPVIEVLAAVTEGRCECERYFFFDGRDVWSFRSRLADGETTITS